MSWTERSGGGSYRPNPDLSGTADPTVFGGPKTRGPDSGPEPAPGRGPCVRVVFPVQDAQVVRWTRTHVLARWPDEALDPVRAWVPASRVQRTTPAESSRPDPSDRHDR
jgi:hypothetical protein